MRTLTRELATAGVAILVGTDTPNPLLVPGFSLAHELTALERAGLSRAAILRAATLGAAEYLGTKDEAGEIARGRRADLVLLRGNPLESLDHVGSVEAVVVRGRLLERGELDTMLETVAADRAAAQ
jgi:imidazolonepropionase-like amidohydrolase